MTAAASAVFTGAGISGDEPAALPRGFALRDAVLQTMHSAARDALGPLVTDDQLDRLRGEAYKLEVVLGRLWGTIGPDALDCVFALRIEVPNEAHLLSALHLLRGGTHVTVNFDIGVELAYDLIRGTVDVPAGAPKAYHDALPAWRALCPAGAPELRTVSSQEEFTVWLREGRPAALLKVHGGLDREQATLADVVVVDIEELGQLTAERAAAVEGLGAATELLITGYSDGDPDVYRPLLAAAARTTATWCCPALIPDEVRDHDIAVVEGVAVPALRQLLGSPGPPPWPSAALGGDGFRERFAAWEKRLRSRHSPAHLAESWAWLLADLGDLDTAIAMTEKLPDARLRLAELLYSRARGDDRDRAARIFRAVGNAADDASTRLHCLLRLGDLARGRAVRRNGTGRVVRDLSEAYTRSLQVLIATRGGRRQPEEGGDAYRLLQQTSLRILEQLASVSPRALWPAIVPLCRAAAGAGGRAERLVRNGNRRALVRQHRALLRALAALLGGRPAPAAVRADMRALRATYRAADDLPGAANCSVTPAVLASADGDRQSASDLIAEALAEYAAGRPDGRPLPSGEALVNVVTRLVGRAGR